MVVTRRFSFHEEMGIVIEVKYPEDGNLEAGCREALKQIEKNRYEELLCDEGIDHILKYGFACYKKMYGCTADDGKYISRWKDE